MISITDVKIRKVTTENEKFKAVASIVIDGCFAIHDVKILQGDESLFIAMPSRRTPDGVFKDVAHPINAETRTYIQDTILEAYQKEIEE